ERGHGAAPERRRQPLAVQLVCGADQARRIGAHACSLNALACANPVRAWGTMPALNAMQEQLCEQSQWDFSDLRALYVNCTLKRSPEVSNTQALGDISIAIMKRGGVSVDVVRAVDHEIATGVQPD